MGTLWIDLLFRDGMVDKDHQTPIMAIDLRIQPIGILDSGQKLQDMVAQIGLALRNQCSRIWRVTMAMLRMTISTSGNTSWLMR